MFEDNNQKFYSFVGKFLKKLRPKFSIHYVVYTILFSFVVFSVVGIVTATTPNPGHPWAELGDGVFAVTNNQTGVRTYTFPDANATILTTNAFVTVAQGGIGIGTLASNGILYGNGTGAVQALAVNAGATQCLTQASSGAPAWGSCGGASGLTIGTTTITSGSTGNILYNNAGVVGEMTTTGSGTVLALATSPSFTTPTLGVASATSINGLTITSSTGTFTLTNAKIFSVSNTLTLAGTDGATLNIGAGGTLGSAAFTASSAYEVPLTFSTGLTRSVNTITNDLSTGVSGGQTVIGGTGAGENLTLSSTSNATKGKIFFGANSAYDGANNRLGIGNNTPDAVLEIATDSLGITQTSNSGIVVANNTPAAFNAQQISPGIRLHGSGWSTTSSAAMPVDWVIDHLPVQGAAAPTSFFNLKVSINGGAYTTPFSVSSAGSVTFSGAISATNGIFSSLLASSSTTANANLETFATTAGLTTAQALNGSTDTQSRIRLGGSSNTVLTTNNSHANVFIQGTNITEATSGTHPLLASLAVRPLAITNGTATTTAAATLYIAGEATGTVPTDNYALWSAGGVNRFDGGVTITGFTNANGVVYASSSGVLAQTATNAGATQCLTQTSGGVPAWGSCGGGGLTVGGAITSGTAGRVLYEDGSNLLAESANYTYDGTTLGVTTSSTTASNKALNISQTGGTTGTDYGGYFSNTGSATTNVGLYTTASGGTTNLGLNVDAGQTLLGGTTLTSGTLAKLNIVSTMTGTGSTTAIAGIHGDYTFNNGGTASYVQVGNRFVFNNAPTTNSNTMVGEVIRTIDNTILANLVRGVEIVSNAGSNTAGTNTGLRSTGATFGVQAITNGSAGGVALPAGLYAENTGTTQGDVARFYTGTMTSAPSMLQVYHDTSTFTGDALLMDMAVGSGTFSGNFLELKNASVLKFKVTSAGVVSMGLSGTASTNAVCSSLANATTPTAGTAYEIRDCNAAPAADYAEMYPVESGIEFGDIVATGTEMVNTYDTTLGNVDWTKVKGKVTRLIKSNKNYQSNVIGIVVDNYGDFTSAGHNIKDSDNPMPVALNGRVPVKVANDSDNIMPGDYITTSNESGKAIKANKAGQVIGKALEAWTSDSGAQTVMIYVEQGFYDGVGVSQFAGIDPLANEFAKQVLKKFMSSQNTNIESELVLDRLAVGLEIITPKLVANQVSTNIINSATGNEIGLALSPDGKFVIGGQTITNTDGTSSVLNPAITFDAFGNATFAGKVTANEIDANSLAGIQDITDQINQLSEGQVAFSLTASVMNTLSGALTIAQADILKLQQDLELIQGTVDGLALDSDDLDTRLKLVEAFIARDEFGVPIGMATVGLSVSGDGLFTGKTQFEGLSFFTNTTSFAGAVSFASQTEFVVPPLYNKNSAGYALVKEGDRRARILFSEPYIATPVVNTSITFETEDNINDTEANTLFGNDVRFIITNKDQTGFTILLNKNAPRDIRFSWNALSVKDPAVFESVFEGLIIDPIPDPIEDEEVSPEDTPTPNETPTCADPQVLDAVANICVDSTPTLDPTIDETPPPEPTSDPSLAA